MASCARDMHSMNWLKNILSLVTHDIISFIKLITETIEAAAGGFGKRMQCFSSSFVKGVPFVRGRCVLRGTQSQFSENICSENDLRSKIFGKFVAKFLACLPLLGFSNI